MTTVWLTRPDAERVSEESLSASITDLVAVAPFAQVQGAGLDRFCRNTPDGLLDENDQPVPLSRLYGIRAFGEYVELRAIRRDQEWDVSVCTESDTVSPETLEVEKFTYNPIVWGTAESNLNGWTILSSKRVGEVAVPIETDERANLEVVEYRGHTDSGNAYLAHSRLSSIATMGTTTEVSDG